MKHKSVRPIVYSIVTFLLIFAIMGIWQMRNASAQGYQCAVYREEGCSREVIASGGSIDVESGGEMDIESGGALKFAGTQITSTATELNILDGATVTVTELNVLDGIAAGLSAAELSILDGVTATAAEINHLDGITADVAELNIMDGVTATAVEINVLDGVAATLTYDELNILDGVTATATEINTLDGVAATLTAAELNILDGVTATATEINVLDGVAATLTFDELNILDGVTSSAAEINQLDGVAVGGTAAGDILTTNGTQTLTNKTYSAPTVTGAVSHTGDYTINDDATGGDAGASNIYRGLIGIQLIALNTMTNGSTETTSYMDDTPNGEYAPTANVTEIAGDGDGVTTHYRIGAHSYGATWAATAVATNGVACAIANDNLEANESIGLWLMPTVAAGAGALQIYVLDDTGPTQRLFDLPALTADVWQWVEVDISALAAGTGDVCTEFGVVLAAASPLIGTEFTLYIDDPWKWDAANEEALGAAIVADGVVSVLAIATAAASDNTHVNLVAGTDYFIHYETGNDFLVMITNQSAASGMALILTR